MTTALDPHTYLQDFGYIASPPLRLFGFADHKALDAGTNLTSALAAFQAFNSLSVTGELDQATIHLMSTPRCGFPDAPFGEFVVHGNKWSKMDLTYGFVETTPDLGDPKIRLLTSEVLSHWAGVTPLTFQEAHSGTPDLVIRFVQADHQDGFPFDGPSNVLAHAFYPPPNGGHLAGDIHFDESEKWVDGGPGIDYPTIALHEAGHALGLAHSPNQSSVMYAYYNGPRRSLTTDDILGVQFLYGAKAAPPPPPDPTPSPPTTPADGWLSYAIRMPRTDGAVRVNPGTNSGKGMFLHSAEGYKTTLLDLATKGPLSWHFSVTFDGTTYQHYPITARCWHATAANQEYIGCEFEGKTPNDPTLTSPQINSAVRLIKDISTLKGWTPRRPTSPTDSSHTLWEHREVTRLGGSGTLCPSNRIPWPEIMARLVSTPTSPYTPETAHAAIASSIQALAAYASLPWPESDWEELHPQARRYAKDFASWIHTQPD